MHYEIDKIAFQKQLFIQHRRGKQAKVQAVFFKMLSLTILKRSISFTIAVQMEIMKLILIYCVIDWLTCLLFIVDFVAFSHFSMLTSNKTGFINSLLLPVFH